LCRTRAAWWLAPGLPADGAAQAATDFAAALARQRLIVWPLGVSTSITALIVPCGIGSLRSRRGGLQIGAAAALLASGVLSSLATEPTAGRIVELLRSSGAGDLASFFAMRRNHSRSVSPFALHVHFASALTRAGGA
jgi:hypothetical protein